MLVRQEATYHNEEFAKGFVCVGNFIVRDWNLFDSGRKHFGREDYTSGSSFNACRTHLICHLWCKVAETQEGNLNSHLLLAVIAYRRKHRQSNCDDYPTISSFS
jgi:hypothetical protein